MANAVLGLGSGQAASLNSDLIEKLKTAEKKSVVDPYETKITNITGEKETFSTLKTKVSELLAAIKPFDLFVSGGVTAFGQKSATTSGDSVTFDAVDLQALKKGFTTVSVQQLATKDVYQSNAVNATTKDAVINQGMLTINGKDFDTTNLTYKQLADKINAESGMNASIEQVGSDSFRWVVKSEDSGIANKLTITGAASQALGFTTDGTAVNSTSHILSAKDLVDLLKEQNIEIAKQNIEMPGPLKLIGDYTIHIKLSSGQKADLKVFIKAAAE